MNNQFTAPLNRRGFLKSSAAGLGAIAMNSLMAGDEIYKKGTHFAPKAKRIIFLFMSGGPSQHDLFDHKPKMHDLFDTDLPDSIRQGQRLTTMTSGQSRFPIAPSMYKFSRHGQSGTEFSELLPYTASMADDIAVMRTVHTDAINHDPAITMIQTGVQLPGKPSLGSWLSYGLGSENLNHDKKGEI